MDNLLELTMRLQGYSCQVLKPATSTTTRTNNPPTLGSVLAVLDYCVTAESTREKSDIITTSASFLWP